MPFKSNKTYQSKVDGLIREKAPELAIIRPKHQKYLPRITGKEDPKWKWHYVAVFDGFVWEVVLRRKVQEQDYLEEMFGRRKDWVTMKKEIY